MNQRTASFKASLSFNNRTIAYFCSQIEQQKKILKRIQAVLPAALAKQTRHCLIKDKKLLIYTDSAIWASQLRFYNKIILASIASLTKEPVEIMQIRIMTIQTGLSRPSESRSNIPSAETIEIIRNQSLSVSDHQLKAALLKLSATLKQRSREA
ncbi:MAG: DciA family protein [Methylococcaceae bacterium]